MFLTIRVKLQRIESSLSNLRGAKLAQAAAAETPGNCVTSMASEQIRIRFSAILKKNTYRLYYFQFSTDIKMLHVQY